MQKERLCFHHYEHLIQLTTCEGKKGHQQNVAEKIHWSRTTR